MIFQGQNIPKVSNVLFKTISLILHNVENIVVMQREWIIEKVARNAGLRVKYSSFGFIESVKWR